MAPASADVAGGRGCSFCMGGDGFGDVCATSQSSFCVGGVAFRLLSVYGASVHARSWNFAWEVCHLDSFGDVCVAPCTFTGGHRRSFCLGGVAFIVSSGDVCGN